MDKEKINKLIDEITDLPDFDPKMSFEDFYELIYKEYGSISKINDSNYPSFEMALVCIFSELFDDRELKNNINYLGPLYFDICVKRGVKNIDLSNITCNEKSFIINKYEPITYDPHDISFDNIIINTESMFDCWYSFVNYSPLNISINNCKLLVKNVLCDSVSTIKNLFVYKSKRNKLTSLIFYNIKNIVLIEDNMNQPIQYINIDGLKTLDITNLKSPIQLNASVIRMLHQNKHLKIIRKSEQKILVPKAYVDLVKEHVENI